MKKIILITLLLLGGLPIKAQNYTPYITMSAGITNTSLSIPIIDKDYLDTQTLGNIGLGAEINSKLRLETIYQLRTPETSSYHFIMDYRDEYGVPQSGNAILKGKLSNSAIIGNVFYKILENTPKNSIWIGAGIGQITSKATLTFSYSNQYSKTSYTDNTILWALYLVGDTPLSKHWFFNYGIEFYRWKAFHQKINNISPHLGLHYAF